MKNSKGNSKKNTMIKQGLILILANIIVRFFGFVYRVPLTNMLGDKGNGIYSASFSIYYFFLILSSASFPAVISKLVAERVAKGHYRDAHKVYKVSYVLSASLGFLSMLILFFNAKTLETIIDKEGSYLSIQVLAPTVFFVSILSVYRGYFQGLKNTVPTALSQIVEQIFNAGVSLVGAYFLVKVSVAHGSAGSTLGTLSGALSGLVLIYFIYQKNKKSILYYVYRSKSYEKSFDIAKEILATAFPIILGTAVFSITNIIDAIMIPARLEHTGMFTSDEATILFGQLTGKFLVLTNLPISIATVFSASVIPNISEMRTLKNRRALNKNINLAIKTVMLIAVPSAFGMTILAKEIYLFLYPKFPEGYILMYFGGISIIIVAFNQIIVSVLQGLNKLYLPIISTCIGIPVKIITNYFLIAIPSINILGAIAGTLVSYSVFLLLNLFFLKKVSRTKIIYTITLIKPIIASSIMGIVCYFINKIVFVATNNNALALFTSIFVSGIVYFLVLVLIKSIDEKLILKVPKGNVIVKILKKIKIL